MCVSARVMYRVLARKRENAKTRGFCENAAVFSKTRRFLRKRCGFLENVAVFAKTRRRPRKRGSFLGNGAVFSKATKRRERGGVSKIVRFSRKRRGWLEDANAIV